MELTDTECADTLPVTVTPDTSIDLLFCGLIILLHDSSVIISLHTVHFLD